MDPESEELLLVPVSAHMSLSVPLVLHPDAVIELRVRGDHEATVSVDGQAFCPLRDGDVVKAQRSPHKARFLRREARTSFYATLTQRLSSASQH